MNYSDVVACGPELYKEAIRSGKGVNESYLFVHRVMAEAFKEDLDSMKKTDLPKILTTRLREQLSLQR